MSLTKVRTPTGSQGGGNDRMTGTKCHSERASAASEVKNFRAVQLTSGYCPRSFGLTAFGLRMTQIRQTKNPPFWLKGGLYVRRMVAAEMDAAGNRTLRLRRLTLSFFYF